MITTFWDMTVHYGGERFGSDLLPNDPDDHSGESDIIWADFDADLVLYPLG